MKLSTIVPVYNEQRHLEEVIRFLFATPCPAEREWIFVDDCSTDGSVGILRRLQKEFGFLLLEQKTNQGKGTAIRRGVQHATGDLILIQDADFEYDPRDIPALIAPFADAQIDVVYGSRFKHNAPQVHRTYHYFVNHFLTVLSNLFSGIYLTDMETCYKVFRADLLKSMNLTSKRFGFEIEVTAFIAKTSARIFEIGIHYYPRTYIQGKKISWKDGVAALFHLVHYNFFVSREKAFKQLPVRYSPEAPRLLRPSSSVTP
ncbi:glycosyltransferase family 2 protein [bacterium]|nr:glycosyltransferase family 2 protein [bacterium]